MAERMVIAAAIDRMTRSTLKDGGGQQSWRPLAAILSRMERTTPAETTGPASSSLAASTLQPVTFIAANQDVWHQVVLHGFGDASTTMMALVATPSAADTTAAPTSGVVLFEIDVQTLELLRMTGTAVALALLILATVIGNMFVIAAILLERNLQNVANYLILSLAVADLLVACLVMPLGAVYAVNRQWALGPELCDMWTSSDVLCCTASILHLVAIAVDRYWAVTNVDYIHRRTAKRIGCMIAVVWSVSFLVCIAPLLGWKDAAWERRVLVERQCLVSQDLGYQAFATASSFYLPLLAILALYWRIYQTARKRIRRRRDIVSRGVSASTSAQRGGIVTTVVAIIGRPLPTLSEPTTTTTTTTAFTAVSSNNSSPEKTSVAVNGLEAVEADLASVTDCGPSILYQQRHHHRQPYYEADDDEDDEDEDDNAENQHHGVAAYAVSALPPLRRAKEAVDSKRERKAAKTLAIITGAFVVCWLPFFVLAIVLPVYERWPWSDFMTVFFLWLGYFNSTLNPIIYTVFSPEFRQAFKKILYGRTAYARRLRHYRQQQQKQCRRSRQQQPKNNRRMRTLGIRHFR